MDTTVTQILKTFLGDGEEFEPEPWLCYRVTTLRPLLVVPGLFCTEIYDDELGYIWGQFRQLYGGPPIGTWRGCAEARGRSCTACRCCSASSTTWSAPSSGRSCAGGYRHGETLHYFAYDWRRPVVELGVTLAAEVRRLAAATGDEIDILGLSNGGPIVRAAYAADRTLPVARVVTSGGAHAGTVETVACLDAGFRFAPLGRRVTPEEFMSCPGGLDSIPEPSSVKFLPEDAGYDLYDVETWRRLRMSVFRRHPDDPVWTEVVAKRLAGVAAALPRARWGGAAPPAGVHLRHRPADAGPNRRREGARAPPRRRAVGRAVPGGAHRRRRHHLARGGARLGRAPSRRWSRFRSPATAT